MIIQRSNITEILGGIPFSKNFSISQMQTSIESALPNIKETYPQLYQDLGFKLIEVDKLIKQEKIIQNQAELIVKLQSKIESTQSSLNNARLVYETRNQLIVGIIGLAPTGGSPIYPPAKAQTQPLINTITQIDKSLSELKEQLVKKTAELTESSFNQKEQVESIGATIQSSIESVDSIEYNTDINQYIYT